MATVLGLDDIYRHVQNYEAALVDHVRTKRIWDEALKRRDLPGEFWECGVYRGGTSYVLYQAIRQTTPRVQRMFDSFQGLPKEGPEDKHHEGEFASTMDHTMRIFSEGVPDTLRVHPGWIPDTFQGMEQCQIALAHVDLDLYEGTGAAIDFIWPRVVPGGALILDDYGLNDCPGVKLAVDERFEAVSQRSTQLILTKP